MKKKIKDIYDIFYRQGLPPGEQLQEMLTQPLKKKADFAEIYIQHSVGKSFKLSERKISDIATSYVTGAGVRVIKGNNTGYSYTEDLSGKNILRCIKEAVEIAGSSRPFGVSGFAGKHNLYDIKNSIDESAGEKVNLLRRAEKKAFSLSPLVEKAHAYLSETNKTVLIINSSGIEAVDVRPMISFNISVIVNKNNVRESGYQGGGGRIGLSYFEKNTPEQMAEEAVNQAMILLEAKPAPAGEMEVVLGAGESGILLHESIGHPLEADFNYRGSSAFSGRIGEKIASEQCTIVDQGDLPLQRGSLNVDDEGNDTGKSVLIENGILRTYMFDLITANHFKTKTLNGRRDEIIKSVKKGIYAKTFSGGQVEISSGDFVFSITEGYLIENGTVGYPIKNATLIGNGPEILKRVLMVGNDLVISDGKWTCGKDGQTVPVGVGMPTVKLSHITVGGTQNG
jgi:TldD protein